MTRLEEFDISHNKMGGGIPPEFGGGDDGDANALEVFKATNNNLVGRVPTQLGNLASLGILMLGKC